MTRPSLNSILSNVQSWDALINDNNLKITGSPFPLHYETSLTNLNTNKPANQYDACIAVVWNGTPGSAAKIYVSNGTSWIDPLVSTSTEIAVIDYQENDGVVGAALVTGAWTKVNLNTIEQDFPSWMSLSSGVVTLQAGTYRTSGMSISLRNHAAGFNDFTFRFRNTSDNVDVNWFMTSMQNAFTEYTECTTFTIGSGKEFTLASAKTFEFQYYKGGTGSGGNIALNSVAPGYPEKYARVALERL